MLGLYTHCESSPSAKRMIEFYQLIQDETRHRHFHHWLLMRQDAFCCFIIRAYLVFLLPFQPALARAMHQTCPWDAFTRICSKAGHAAPLTPAHSFFCKQVARQTHEHIDRYGWALLLLGDATPSVPLTPSAASRVAKRKRATPVRPFACRSRDDACALGQGRKGLGRRRGAQTSSAARWQGGWRRIGL